MTHWRCGVILESGLQCRNKRYLHDNKCFVHAQRERKNRENLPPLGPPPRITERFEARAAGKRATTTSTTPHMASLALEPPNSVSVPLLVSNACSHGYSSWTECGECTNAADEDRGAL